MDLNKTIRSDNEEEFIKEKPESSEINDHDILEEFENDDEIGDEGLFVIAQEDESPENHREAEWLDEKEQNDEVSSEENHQHSGDLKFKEKIDDLRMKCPLFENEEISKADMFVCDLCHQVFNTGYKLRGHLLRLHGIKKKEGPAKANWLPDVQKLVKRVDSKKVFMCDKCPYTVTRCDSMTKHVLRVHSKGLVKPQYMCEVCGKTFVDRAYLRNHGLTHIQDPQFFCEICGRRFHRQPSLKRHIQSHSDEKQFSCSLCDYQTNRKHLMYKHTENHRTGKAYVCKFCHEKFFTQVSLRKHNFTHHSTRYSCSLCKIAFSSRERLWTHLQKLHFACEVKDIKPEASDEVQVEYIEVKVEPTSCS